MKNIKRILMLCVMVVLVAGCKKKKEVSFEDYPVRSGDLSEMVYSPDQTEFSVWSPIADEVRLMLFESGHEGHALATIPMKKDSEGTWHCEVDEDLLGKFYAFNVKIDEVWQGETPGINAKAVGVNGNRAAIIDWEATHPEGWENDVRPSLKSAADIVLYEMHHRDFSIHSSSGIQNKGKYLALTENKTTNAEGLATGIDHLIDLGVTHVHLLPSFDFATVDEEQLEKNTYNWGYDPKNYNVPEGSYATDPYNPVSRIKEFKKMVLALHKAGIRVVMDVVYNHTHSLAESNFERTAPGYFYRHNPDGTYADGSACGNETASERAMMRKYMIESIQYWINEYHIDGFRFDLMGIHDIETIRLIQEAAHEIDPTIYIYGEGWAAVPPQMETDLLAMKANTFKMPHIAAFSDEMRDALRGPFNDDAKGAFLIGLPNNEESVKFGVVGAIEHPQIDYSQVNYTDKAWALQPTQMISYVSCHDDLCLVDRLKSTLPKADEQTLLRLNKLAQTVVFTSQGVPFIYAGEEVFRDKKGVANSYQSPDSINQIDWENKTKYLDLYNYYKGLIQLRKNHPAFRMGDADLVRKHLEFLPIEEDNVVGYQLKDFANQDTWEEITVLFNAQKNAVKVNVPVARYRVVCLNGQINENGLGVLYGPAISVPAQSALIMYKDGTAPIITDSVD
ncbi:MAG: type I pullulanase [Bacteroidales bacterium]|nr:type I pullulanase [Bacteroidales bacterium]